jgi:hypothetical protein
MLSKSTNPYITSENICFQRKMTTTEMFLPSKEISSHSMELKVFYISATIIEKVIILKYKI